MHPLKKLERFAFFRLTSTLLVLGLFLISCHMEQPQSTPAPSATKPLPTETPPIIETRLVEATPTPKTDPSLTPIPTESPTRTPLPAIRLAVPDQWQERAKSAIDVLNQESGAREWGIVSQETAADINLVKGKGHIIVGQLPLALTVPFTTNWENTTIENAELIISEGHELVTVIPWSAMPPYQKALRIDGRLPTDADYPLQEEWSLMVSPGFKQAGAELQKALKETSDDVLVHLVAVGDLMLDRSLSVALQQGNIDYPFTNVSESLLEADLTIGNLESALGDIGEPAKKRYQFRAPPEAAESLASAGFDIISLANNHAMDFGHEGLLQGMELLNEQGIKTTGAGINAQAAHAPALVEVNELKMAFLSYVHVPVEAITGFDTADWTATDTSPGLAWADPEQIASDVHNAQNQSDLVVVLLHSGHEYVAAPSEPQVAAAHAAIDAGADLVIGHHTHVLQGIEFYEDGVIIYGTGNFAFEIDGDPQTALFHIWMDQDGVRQIEIDPAIIQFGGQPRLADESESAAILNQVYYLTNVLN